MSEATPALTSTTLSGYELLADPQLKLFRIQDARHCGSFICAAGCHSAHQDRWEAVLRNERSMRRPDLLEIGHESLPVGIRHLRGEVAVRPDQ